jgi:hypothetical protein
MVGLLSWLTPTIKSTKQKGVNYEEESYLVSGSGHVFCINFISMGSKKCSRDCGRGVREGAYQLL